MIRMLIVHRALHKGAANLFPSTLSIILIRHRLRLSHIAILNAQIYSQMTQRKVARDKLRTTRKDREVMPETCRLSTGIVMGKCQKQAGVPPSMPPVHD
jgi:hypothetical protein